MRKLLHPIYVRLTHWVNAATVLVMIGSGLQIHNAYPIVPFTFPSWMTIGDWLGGALLWHFAAMWVFTLNLVVMVVLGVFTGRYRLMLLPVSPRMVISDVTAALSGRGLHDPSGRYNAVQKVLYLGILMTLVVLVASGLALWKPVQFQGLTAAMGGFQGARVVHFAAMAGVVAFLILHVAMAILVPRTLRQMTLGR
ncbi:MAG: cytochrome b/b6 domain-containing protein [Paracoccaceae bacterium]